MDKFSELKAAAMSATPGPWEWFTSNSMARLSSTPSGKDGDVLSAFRASDGVPCVSVSQRDMAFIAAANPAVVLALLAELEAKDEQNKLLMREIEHGKKLRVNMQNNADSLSERIAELERSNQAQDDHINQQQDRIESLEKKNGDLGRSLGAAEKRLATPVRLPEKYNMKMAGDKSTKSMFYGHNSAINDSAKAIRAAG
ncbi:ead/Ea22-like family protein, partial [Streptomyces sp. NPDC048430]|uniref:ead/Ea22-like family protein n=1 Tax=Streptomyces sp. NPDC048430 TaxID=3155388 RepID=UPI003415F9E9